MITVQGKEYGSMVAACKAYKINTSTVYDRIKKGWELELAITTPNKTKIPVKDHLGKEYESFAAMAKAYGLKGSMVRNRVEKYGWTLKEALMISPVNSRLRKGKERELTTQDNYDDLQDEVKRLKKKIEVLEATVKQCRGADIKRTYELTKKIASAGVYVSGACSYASYLENEVHKF